ncbi:MAG: 5' nucleotidase, NT5C type [Bacteroidota bacterium]
MKVYFPEKKILYVDMDGVVADFEKAIRIHVSNWDSLNDDEKGSLTDSVCGQIPGFFENLEPIEGAIKAVKQLAMSYETYFLSAAMWNVPNSYTEKRIWIQNHFGDAFRKKLILTHRKDLNFGHYLVDDRTSHGAGKFMGQHIQFGSKEFPDWKAVENYLISWELRMPDFNADGTMFKI